MALSPSDIERTNPAGWPEAALGRFQRAITVEYTSLTRAGLPIMIPLTPFLGEDQLSVDVSTGLTYPANAERARRNPKVCLLFSDPVGSGLSNPPIVLVQGLARLASSRPHGSWGTVQREKDDYVFAVERALAGFSLAGNISIGCRGPACGLRCCGGER